MKLCTFVSTISQPSLTTLLCIQVGPAWLLLVAYPFTAVTSQLDAPISALIWQHERVPLPVSRTCFSAASSYPEHRQFALTHIPKTARASLQTELKLPGNQGCYLDRLSLYPKHAQTIFFRSPRSHVVSQFFDCSDSAWGTWVTNHTAFPRSRNLPGGQLEYLARTLPRIEQ